MKMGLGHLFFKRRLDKTVLAISTRMALNHGEYVENSKTAMKMGLGHLFFKRRLDKTVLAISTRMALNHGEYVENSMRKRFRALFFQAQAGQNRPRDFYTHGSKSRRIRRKLDGIRT